jgi:hypothetical protein
MDYHLCPENFSSWESSLRFSSTFLFKRMLDRHYMMHFICQSGSIDMGSFIVLARQRKFHNNCVGLLGECSKQAALLGSIIVLIAIRAIVQME